MLTITTHGNKQHGLINSTVNEINS